LKIIFNFVNLVVCLVGLYLVIEFRLLGLFGFVLLLVFINKLGFQSAIPLPKHKEEFCVRLMYGLIFVAFSFSFIGSYAGFLEAMSLKLASLAKIPSMFDNAAVLMNADEDGLKTLLSGIDDRKRVLLEYRITHSKMSYNYSPIMFYITNVVSFAALIIFVVLVSTCLRRPRLAYIDTAEVALINSRAKANIKYDIKFLRHLFCWVGVCSLAVYYLYFVQMRLDIGNTGALISTRPYTVFVGLMMQLIAQFALWNFARPFFTSP